MMIESHRHAGKRILQYRDRRVSSCVASRGCRIFFGTAFCRMTDRPDSDSTRHRHEFADTAQRCAL